MDYYAGIDVSLEASSVCVVNTDGQIVREAKVLSEPAALIDWFEELGFGIARIGLEAGPLSQWLFAAMKQAGLAVELLETRHVRDAFKAGGSLVAWNTKSLAPTDALNEPEERGWHPRCSAYASRRRALYQGARLWDGHDFWRRRVGSAEC